MTLGSFAEAFPEFAFTLENGVHQSGMNEPVV